MFKGLTQRAQKVLTILAQDEAKRFHSDQLLPEHIMLALLKEGGGMGFRALVKAGVDPAKMQIELEKVVPRKRGGFILGDVPPSPRGKRVLEDSADEAKSLGHEFIGTEHLLLACAREGNSETERILAGYMVTVDMLREIVISLIDPSDESGSHSGLQGSLAGAAGAKGQEQGKGQKKSASATAVPGKKATPTLDEFSRDLTNLARENKLDPVIGRERAPGPPPPAPAGAARRPRRRHHRQRRGPGPADRRRQRPGHPAGQAGHDPGPGQSDRRHQVPRRV